MKRIFVQSENNDISTDDVLNWMIYLSEDAEIIRTNDATIKTFTYDISNTGDTLKLEFSDNQVVNSKEIAARWYRRGMLNFGNESPDKESEWSFLLSLRLQNHVAADHSNLLKGIDKKFSTFRSSINKFTDNYMSKMDNLLAAKESGLEIPETIITNDTRELERFIDRHEKVITKPFGVNTIQIDLKDYIAVLSCYTSEVDQKMTRANHQKFASSPSLYQEYVSKKYELRIFMLMDRIFPMAIFSQDNSKTRLDFRNYDDDRPNRCIPYTLPETIAGKLKSFMNASNMNCGSVDMIVTPDGRYVFLEVNPVGQFQWLSRSCNYDIERTIAKILLSEHERK